jgi:hypothetical protein
MAALVSAIENGAVYVNVITSKFANGEIRGQLSRAAEVPLPAESPHSIGTFISPPIVLNEHYLELSARIGGTNSAETLPPEQTSVNRPRAGSEHRQTDGQHPKENVNPSVLSLWSIER